MVYLVFWLLQCCEEIWFANSFEINYVSQEHGTVFLFCTHGLYSFGVTLGWKKKFISKFQKLQCKRVCKSRVSNTLAVYLDLLPLLDFFLESFFLVFSGGGGGCSSSSSSSSSPCPSSSSSSSSLPTPPTELAFRLANELGPLLVVATLGGAVLAPLSSSSLLPWELSLSPLDAYISTCKA